MDDPGVKFQPTDEELIVHYLNRKIESLPSYAPQYVVERDLYGEQPPWNLLCDHSDPWQKITNLERYIYLISPLKNVSKNRISRVAGCGVWHAEGKPMNIYSDDNTEVIGFKKTYSFEVTVDEESEKEVVVPEKGHYIMHEYSTAMNNNNKNYVICKISRDDSKPVRRSPQWRRLGNKKMSSKKKTKSNTNQEEEGASSSSSMNKRARPGSYVGEQEEEDLLQKDKKAKTTMDHTYEEGEEEGGQQQQHPLEEAGETNNNFPHQQYYLDNELFDVDELLNYEQFQQDQSQLQHLEELFEGFDDHDDTQPQHQQDLAQGNICVDDFDYY